MKEKELNPILSNIQQEVANLNAALELIEVASNSVKRERYCKKRNLSYSKFMQIYNQARSEILMYPLRYHVMIAIINQRKNTRKEYKILSDIVIEQLKKIIDSVKQQEVKAPEAEKMKEFLENLKKEKPDNEKNKKNS